MQQTMPFDLENRIITALTDSESELWFPHLTYDLMRVGLQRIYDKTNITEEEYATVRVIQKDADAKRVFEGSVFTRIDQGEIKNETFVEMLPASIKEQYKDSGVDFYTREELRINNEIKDCLRHAFEIIRCISSLFSSVRYLVKSIHLIKPEDDEYDISFSEPYIPFTIFVSVPQKNNLINALRVAEAIIHEAMHLQLTLIEDIIPLVISSSEKVYSPWKSEYRTLGGIIHALYVFRNIDLFFEALARCLPNSIKSEEKYISSRRTTIHFEIEQIQSLNNHISLTYIGKQFVNLNLLRRLHN
jgi:HEXXH motif-containing protein